MYIDKFINLLKTYPKGTDVLISTTVRGDDESSFLRRGAPIVQSSLRFNPETRILYLNSPTIHESDVAYLKRAKAAEVAAPVPEEHVDEG